MTENEILEAVKAKLIENGIEPNENSAKKFENFVKISFDYFKNLLENNSDEEVINSVVKNIVDRIQLHFRVIPTNVEDMTNPDCYKYELTYRDIMKS